MLVELITKTVAIQKYQELKGVAYAIAEANGSLPGYCNAPECKLFVAYASLVTGLEEGEVCIFINGEPAEQLTDIEISPGNFLISKISTRNVREVKADMDTLLICFHDGVIEEFIFLQDVQLWKFKGKNISVNIPSTSAN